MIVKIECQCPSCGKTTVWLPSRGGACWICGNCKAERTKERLERYNAALGGYLIETKETTYNPDRIKYILSEALRFKAENEFWNDYEIAKEIGGSRSTIFSWLAGNRKPHRGSALLESLERFLQERGYTE